MDRTKGFVIAQDDGIFKVRVQGGAFDGQKLRVESTHENCQLALRLNVDFLIGTAQGRNEQYPVAIDVRPAPAFVKCDHCPDEAEFFLETSGSEAENAHYTRSCLPHFARSIQMARNNPVRGRRIIKVISIARGDKQWRELIGV